MNTSRQDKTTIAIRALSGAIWDMSEAIDAQGDKGAIASLEAAELSIKEALRNIALAKSSI